ncbi:sugar ABC transporter substrate-binding protein [Fuchsiella alkaliacetigena]|uniref:sugar ABC transporter substrate-binding protein n=1 Tax=Fuchsiella alkaliacetigena TaxID=957042 RepID=UPI00200B2DB6|nr:sugar ABC transporter substrate-binding protein [Fuchsiella alkaliacetigena]MCK8824220.1 sugar ABC transporter substrate-binding protein [Fuchsiella alkaliacetigena]
MKKRFITVILCLTLVFVLVGCGSSGDEAAPDIDEVVIGITNNNVGIDSYQTTHYETFREEAEELGVETVRLDATGDPALQVNQIEDLIQQQVDVIVVWPVSGDAIVPAVRNANQQGIPVLIANSPIDESGFELVEGFAGPDNLTQGKYAAQMMKEALDGEGKVVELMGLPGYVTAHQRSDGFNEEVENYSGIEVIETQPADWDRSRAQEVMEDFLTKFPSGQIDGVYAADDNIAMGAINALEEAGRLDEVKITSATMFGDGYDAMKEGKIYGTIYQSPVEDARKTVQTAVRIATGEEVEFFNYFDTPKVTLDNIDEYERPIW